MTEAVPTVLIDNERTRVTRWRFAPGARTGWHRHEMDYVIMPMTTGALRIELRKDGSETVTSELTTGVPYYREVGVEHDVVNANDYDFEFVEIELK